MFKNVFLPILVSTIILWNCIQININVDLETCPYCFGTDFCVNLSSIGSVRCDSFKNIFNYFFGVKNVYFIANGLVLKKLGSEADLHNVNNEVCGHVNCDFSLISDSDNDYQEKVNLVLQMQNDNILTDFKLCSGHRTFMKLIQSFKNDDVNYRDYLKNIWTILKVNNEPLLLQLLKSENGWPVPKYYGACGRAIIVEDAGSNLNEFKNHNFTVRSYLALQLLQAARMFTNEHQHFRFYLTDVSPDNIAVDHNYYLKFVDLENVIVTGKVENVNLGQHQSDIYDVTGFAYSEQDICHSSISDHNFYAVCQLLLSRKSPWPMMHGGLLHTVPDVISKRFPELEVMLELCAVPTENSSRYEVVEDLIELLHEIIIFLQ